MLDATQTFSDLAKSGTASPMMLFEMRSTTHFSELSNRSQCIKATNRPEDDTDGTDVNGLNLAHQTDELRLASAEVLYSKRSQLDRLVKSSDETSSGRDLALIDSHDDQMFMIQTFKIPRSFRLNALRLGIYDPEGIDKSAFKGKVIVRIYRNVGSADGDNTRNVSTGQDNVFIEETLLGNAEKIAEKTLDFSNEEAYRKARVEEDGQVWTEIDFREDKIWLPGNEEPLAFTVEPQTHINLGSLVSTGSDSRNEYLFGHLFRYRPAADKYVVPNGDLAFQLIAEGFKEQGVGYWEFDLKGLPDDNSYGEFELVYNTPANTTARFSYRKKVSVDDSFSGAWKEIENDGEKFSGRFLQIKIELKTYGDENTNDVRDAGEDTDNLDTPSIYLIRAAIKRKDRMLLASRSRFGYPNCVAEAPDYSAEGNPLTGEASTSDTSRITMFDPSGMISRMFSLYRLKNDEIKVFLGFDDPRFSNLSDSDENDYGDWLPFKSIWIEDWQPSEGLVTIHCYDQQVRFKQAEAPQSIDPPMDTEEIHFDGRSAASIKRELLGRARIRNISIDEDSFKTLEESFPLKEDTVLYDEKTLWSFHREIDKPTKLQSLDTEINRHLLSFQVVDENGKWVTRFVDFEAEPTEIISGNDILSSSERYFPGMKNAKNVSAVFLWR